MKIIAQSDVVTLASVYDGIGISSVVPQYYLSTSETETINGIWSYEQPVWSSGHYIWTRSEITNSDNEVTYTTPIVATALNSANKAASDASTKADSAYDTAESASETANTASTTAADAKKIASSANDISAQANTKAEKAESDATQAIQISNNAKDGVAAVNQDISSLKATVDGMNTDISTAQQNIAKNAEAITGINQNLSTNYATKTEVSDTKASLETDISTSASNLAASVKETYASKSEVSTVQGDLENKIQVNTDGLSATSKKVTSLESQTSTISQNLTNAAKTAEDAQKNAQAAIASAKTAQNTADTAVNTAKAAGDKATEAQNQLDAAKKKVADADAELKTAKANYDSALSAYNSVSADPNATAVQIETAKEKLTQAQTALSKALADVLTANHDVTDAQTATQDALNNAVTAYQNAEMAMKDAKIAQDTADQAVASAKKANEDLAALTNTVNTQETKITQNSNSITSLANRTTTVENKFTGYYTKSEADSKIKQVSDSITSTVSQTYETKTDSASKLSSAKSYADSSSSQALKDAKADTDNKLKSYSTTTQMNSAIDQKADSITTTVSKTYETKTDSASKLSSANSYTDSKIKQTSDSITQQINSVNNGKNMVQQINLNSGGLKINVDKVEIGSAISNLVTGTVNEYAINTSSSTSPTSGWSATQPAWADGKYIWMRTKTTKKDGTVSYSNPACITGAKGSTGATGAQGPKGENGVDLSNGKMLFTDPYFAFSNNSCHVYNLSSNENVKIERVGISSDNPFSATNVTSYELKIINTGTANPGCGGFRWSNIPRANAIFIYRIIAKIPTGRHLLWASNAIGNSPSEKWLTSNDGTGKFTEYIFKLICGDTGTFSTTGYFYIDGSIGTTDNPIEWRVAYATCFDMTSGSDVTTALSTAAGKNKTVYSENADPSATTGYVSGDTWFNKATGGIWQFDGKAWKLHQVGTVSISNGAVTADKINVNELSAISANMGTVTAGAIKSSDNGNTFTMDATNKKLNWNLPQTKMSDTGEITTTKQAVEPYGASNTANYTYETFTNSDGFNASKKADLSETNYLHEISDLTGDGLAMLSSQRSANNADLVSHCATGVNHGSVILSSYLSQYSDNTKISNYKTTTITPENIETTRITASESIKCKGNEVLTSVSPVVFTNDFSSKFNNQFANNVESYQCIRRAQTGWSTHVASARGAMHHIVALNSMLYIVWLASTADINVARLHDGKGGSGQWNAYIDSARFHRLNNNYIEVFNNNNASITIFS